MAGGSGTRFWPGSRRRKPKQLLDLLGSGKSLLRSTFERTAKIVPAGNILIVTGEVIADEVKASLPELPGENILLEPVGRNTTPCIGWACSRILAADPDALASVFPSDHFIMDEPEFIRVINAALDRVQKEDRIVTVGIRPTRPDTGYGYIEGGDDVQEEVKKVLRFVEKPDIPTAQKYLEQGNFFWNGGIFIFRARRMMDEIKANVPDTHSALLAIQSAYDKGGLEEETGAVAQVYPGIKGISIDYGVMEKASDVEVIPAEFGWSDLGSWRAIYEKMDKDENENALRGDGSLLVHEAKRCLASTEGRKAIALVGVEDIIVVDTGDALLVCSMSDDQKVREIVAQLKEKDKGKL